VESGDLVVHFPGRGSGALPIMQAYAQHTNFDTGVVDAAKSPLLAQQHNPDFELGHQAAYDAAVPPCAARRP